jgi:hypothetical protein
VTTTPDSTTRFQNGSNSGNANEREPRSVARRFLGADRDEDLGDVVIRAPR